MKANENNMKLGSVGGVPLQTRKTISQLSTVEPSIENKVLPNVVRSQASLDRFNSSSPFGVMQTLENATFSFPVTIQTMNFSFESIRNS